MRARHLGHLAAAAILLVLGALAGPAASAAPPAQGASADWPCQQRLVPTLAAANYWSAPMPADLGDWHADRAVADLVQRLAPRRVSTEEGLKEIAAYARNLSGDRRRELALAFRGLLDESNGERAGLIEELDEIGHRQRELADLVAQLATELRAIPADATGDAAAQRTDLQQRHDFTERNFEEIQRTIRYACETPIALDARLGAWARALQQAGAR
jgi:hypothetical protein